MSTIKVTNIHDTSNNVSLVTDNAGIKTDKLTGNSSASSISVVAEGGSTTTNLQQGLAKAWVFGSDAAALTKSFNIASGTDNGTGDYTYAITNDMDSANFACTVSGAGGGRRYAVNMARAAGTFTLKLFDDNEAAADNPNAGKVHGDLA